MGTIESSRLPQKVIRLIEHICNLQKIPTEIIVHPITKSAAETQAVLPRGCLVQKTVTGRVAGKLLLWTGVSDFTISKQQRKYAARSLSISPRRDYEFNPTDIVASRFFSMQEGMVSPFLIDGTPALARLSAVFLLPWPVEWESMFTVAISLSLTESLMLPLSHFNNLFSIYVQSIYGDLQVVTVPRV